MQVDAVRGLVRDAYVVDPKIMRWAVEPNADDLALVEHDLVTLVTAIRDESEWRGVADAETCRTCRYRSICPDSAAPGLAEWPRVDDDIDTDAP